MKNLKSFFFSISRRSLVKCALVCTVFSTAAVSSVYASETAVAASSAGQLKIGDNHGGGKVAYVFQSGDEGYVAGQIHGVVASRQDLGNGTTWEKAVQLCQEYRAGGFSDWRLPSKAELNRLYANKIAVGGFKNHHYYWSSSESDKNDAWDQSFRSGVQNLGYKLDNNYVRAVRTF
ncbi:MAG: DUF1566 domain-containing protein [Chlorobiaceae bacterium]|nr:DUF1566 domain-containing protein [Chlorobiaceae bacterium]